MSFTDRVWKLLSECKGEVLAVESKVNRLKSDLYFLQCCCEQMPII